MFSQGFFGTSAARYFPNVVTPVPALPDAKLTTGMDLVNQYEVSFGAGTTSSTFYTAYTDKQIKYNSSVYDVCGGYQNLSLIMGLIDISLRLLVLQENRTQFAFIEVVYTYTYNGVTITERALIPGGEYISSVVYLPLPAFESNTKFSCGGQTLGVVHIPIAVYIDTTPTKLYQNTPSNTGLPVSAYILTDNLFLADKIDTTKYTIVLSDVNSTLKTKFTVNPLLYGTIKSAEGRTFDVKVIGGFRAVIQSIQQSIINGVNNVGRSLPNSVGSVLLTIQNNTTQQ